MDWISTFYPWIKALHIMAVITWMAGLFYLPRLFVYHVESNAKAHGRADVFETMERKLFHIIMQPAMMTAWTCGIILAIIPGVIDWSAIWPWSKLAGILGMTVFHVWLKKQLMIVKTDQALKGRSYRMMNEVPTLLMIIIVISVVVRPF